MEIQKERVGDTYVVSANCPPLCGVSEQVREVLDTGGLAPIIAIHPGRSEGFAALNT